MNLVLVAVLIWVICGVVAAGFHFSYFQDHYSEIAEEHYSKDLIDSYFMIVGGLCALHAMLLLSSPSRLVFKYGWRLWRKT